MTTTMHPQARGTPPWLVALLRGLIEAIILAAIGVLVTALGAVTAGDLAPFAPVGILLLRQLEGVVDQRIDPTKQRALGGAPVTGTDLTSDGPTTRTRVGAGGTSDPRRE